MLLSRKMVLKIIAQKRLHLTHTIRPKWLFYAVHRERAFFKTYALLCHLAPLLRRFSNVIAILAYRDLMGATNPQNAEDGTIRKQFGLSIDQNSVHGSDSPENARSEINFFFNQIEIFI